MELFFKPHGFSGVLELFSETGRFDYWVDFEVFVVAGFGGVASSNVHRTRPYG